MENNNRFIEMYNVLIDEVSITHNRFLDTVTILEDGIREIYRNYNNNNPRNNNPRNSNPRYSNPRNSNPRYSNPRNNNPRNNNHRNYYSRTNFINDNYINLSTPNSRNNPRNFDYLYLNNNRNRNRNIHGLYDQLDPSYTLNSNFLPSLSSIFTIPSHNNNGTLNFNDLTPIIVRPTTQQINNATMDINYYDTEHHICPITQEPFEENTEIIKIIHCQHCFQKEAIMNWFNRSVLCPVCRFDIREYNTINSSLNDNSNNNTTNDISNNYFLPQNSSNNDIESLLSSFTDSISNSLTQHIYNNDISLNNLDNRALNLEYTIQTPNNIFTLSSTANDTIGNILRTLNNNSSNEDSNTNN